MRELIKMRQGNATQRMVSERPLGTSRARAVNKPDNTVGVGRSEAEQMRIKQPVTTRRVQPTGPRIKTGDKTPLGGRPKIGTTSLNAKTTTPTDSRTRDSDSSTKARAATAARDVQESREARESLRSTKIQANDSARTGGEVQHPQAEPMTQQVVKEQARVGNSSDRPMPNKANISAVVKARNRIEATARAAKAAGKTIEAPSTATPGRLGGAHAGGQGISEEEMAAGGKPLSAMDKLGSAGRIGARMATEEDLLP